MEFFINILDKFSLADITIICISALLLLAAKPICAWLNNASTQDERIKTRSRLMRSLNIFIILAIIARTILHSQIEHLWLGKAIQVLIILYFAMLFAQICTFLIRKRFGKIRQVQDKPRIAETYSSRGLSLFVTSLISIIALVTSLKVLGLNSWLETGGVLGIIGLFLAITQAAWAPDIMSGLIILHSRLCEEGDVVQFNQDGRDIVASVFKTKLFHTEFLDIATNHRLMMRNAKLRDVALHNLSRFASARGLRECLLFNIDYKHKENEVRAMFKRAFATLDETREVREEQYKPGIYVYDTGDYAVTWAIYYFTKDVKNIFLNRQLIRSAILAESHNSNISLSTPVLQTANVQIEKQL